MGKLATPHPNICYHPSQYLPYPHRRYCDDSWEALQRPIAKPPMTRRRHSDKKEFFPRSKYGFMTLKQCLIHFFSKEGDLTFS